MEKRRCFFRGCNCFFVSLFLFLFYGRTISIPTTPSRSKYITNKSEVIQVIATIRPTIKRPTLCKNKNPSPTQGKENSSESASVSSHKSGCLRSGATCNTYVGSWSYFYLKIGGWLMLGIVFVGIACLMITHFLGMKKVRTDPRRKRTLSRLSWTDAKTKSILANWI